MEKRRRRVRGPVGAILFALALFVLAAIFIHDWQSTTVRPVIVKATPAEPAESPRPQAVIPEAPKLEPSPADPPVAKAPAEPPKAEPEVVPDPIPEPKAPDEDPWTDEKSRVGDNRGRRGPVIRVNPRVIVQGEAFAFGGGAMMRPPRMVVPDVRVFAPPPMIDPEGLAEGALAAAKKRNVARAAQTLILRKIPEARPFIEGFTSGDGGRLVVNVADAFLRFDDARRKTVMEGIAEVWSDSRYPELLGSPQAVEFRGPGGWKELLEH